MKTRSINYFIRYPIIITLLLIFGSKLSAQENEINKIFNSVESGFKKGDISVFANYFSDRVYVSFKDGKTGYFSTNQLYYIFEDFFKDNIPTSFNYTNTNTDSVNPYAIGILLINNAGKKIIAKVYLSLKLSDSNWRIIQITIN